MILKKVLAGLGIFILVSLAILIINFYPFYRFFMVPKVIPFDAELTLMTGAGNSGIVVTDSAVVVIDTKMGSMAKKLHKLALEKAGDKKIIVINTHFHGDHIYGNRVFKGCRIYIGGYDSDMVRQVIKPEDMPSVFVHDSLELDLGSETVVLFNAGRGHTFDDLVVYLRKHRVLFTGDLVFNKINPALFREEGTDVASWQKKLQQISDHSDCTAVIPGHGDPGGKELITEMETYFRDMQAAATDPQKTREIMRQYSGWMRLPYMSSPNRTIAFIQGK
jgi:cyclase